MSQGDANDMLGLAARTVELAKRLGSQEVAASAYRERQVSVEWRDGRLEKISEATTRGVSLQLYVEGRYSAVSTSDLRDSALAPFIARALAMTRLLAPDPHRSLPDPAYYQGQFTGDLELADTTYGTLESTRRLELAEQIETAAREKANGAEVLSVTTGVSDSELGSYRVHSNGFEGTMRHTSFWLSSEVSVQDPSGKRPEESYYAGSRFLADLPPARTIGEEAMQRALGRIGAGKAPSGTFPMVVDSQSASRLLRYLLGPLCASALQQRQSFFEGKLGTQVLGPLVTLRDDPWIPKGLGSRLYDGEGIASKPLSIFNAGVLEHVYVDHYYGKKLEMPVTTRSPSNLVFELGDKALAELVRDVGDGVLVTGFLGGNANGTTGDFSLGVQGFAFRGGAIAEPISEMNISGNQLELWNRLQAVGNDPWPYSAVRIPSLVFGEVQFAGS